MTVPSADLVVSFRDAAQPRALASRLIASAHRHPLGWTAHIPGVGSTEHVTLDAAAKRVARATGVACLLIVWPERHQP
jgi:hypothetical protein